MVLEPTQPPIQWVPRTLLIWCTLLNLVLRLRMSGALPPFPQCLHGMHRASFTLTLPQQV